PVAGVYQMDFSPQPVGKHDFFIKVESGTGVAVLDDITLVTETNTTGQGTANPVVIANPNFDLALMPTGTVQGWTTEFFGGGTFTSNSSWGRVGLTAAGTEYWHSQQ